MQRDPRTLYPSPILAGIWMLNTIGTDDSDAEYQAGLASVRATGVQVPLTLITGTNEIADGRHRHEWALAAGLEAVPVVEVDMEEALRIIDREIFSRRAMTKSQRAWSYLCLHPALAEGKTGPKKGNSEGEPPNSLEAAGEAAGVSRHTMKEAAALHRLLANDKRFTKAKTAAAARKDVELRIWQGDGLGQILTDLKPGPGGAANKESGPAEPANVDVIQQATVEKYAQLMMEWDTELDAVKSYAHLPDAALHSTAAKMVTAAGVLTAAEMARPDIPATHKQQTVTALRDAMEAAIEAARLGGVTLKA